MPKHEEEAKQEASPTPAWFKDKFQFRPNKFLTLGLFAEAFRLSGIDPNTVGALSALLNVVLNSYVSTMTRKEKRTK